MVIFNHALTEEQRRDLKESWGVSTISSTPQEVKNLWGNIPPEADTEEVKEISSKIVEEISKILSPGDCAVVQGEPTVWYYTIQGLKELGIKPLVATTKREAIEIKEGEKIIKKAVFKHIRFREIK